VTEAIPGFPWVLEQPLHHLDAQAPAAREAVLAEHAAWQAPADGHNFAICSRLPFFASLYAAFLAACEEVFAPFTLRTNNAAACWAYVQNRERFASVWHDHTRTCSINGVYYLAVPDPAGAIRFKIGRDEWELEPREGSLYLFPRWLVHRPMPQTADAWRISINVEVLTNEQPTTRSGRSWWAPPP
jgi:hypothetical protein